MERIRWSLFALYASAVDGLEAERKAQENRLRSLELPPPKGMGWADVPEVIAYREILTDLKAAEKKAIGQLEQCLLEDPLAVFLQDRKGVGAKGIARLLAVIHNPASRANVGELRSYCGHGDPERSRRRSELVTIEVDAETGQRRARLPFSPLAKSRLWVVSESAYRGGYYREVYVQARAACEGKLHSVQCQNSSRDPKKKNGCGTQAHPEKGAPGSPWEKGHRHAHALRMVGKQILKDLYAEAVRLASV